MIERFANNRLYRISYDNKKAMYKVVGCEAYNAIVEDIWIETDEVYYFEQKWQISEFLTSINGGVKVFL